jgi:hypothetical protein
MENKETAIILPESNESAEYREDIKGWVSADGHWYNNEQIARRAGATHIHCEECGEIIPKRGYVICEKCRDKENKERYYAMPEGEWVSGAPITMMDGDMFFWDEDDILEYVYNVDGTRIEDMRLVICEPTYAREIEPDEYYEYDLPLEQKLEEVNEGLYKKIMEVNEYIRINKPVLSWSPSKYRLKEDKIFELQKELDSDIANE